MFTVSKATILFPYVNFARQIGIPAEVELRRAGLPVHFDEFPNAWLPTFLITKFIDGLLKREPEAEYALGQFSPDPSACLHPAMWLPLSRCGTLYQALGGIQDLSEMHISQFQSLIVTNDQTATFKFWLPQQERDYSRAEAVREARSCEMLIGIIQKYVGPEAKLKRIFLRARSKIIKAAVENFSGDVPVLTGHSFSGAEFSRSLLTSSPDFRDEAPTTKPSNETLSYADLAERLTACLEPYLMEGHPHISLGAEIAGTSVRTLQRRLSNLGTNYEKVVDNVRCRKAQKLLDEGVANIKDIAHILGYSEQSAFSRAFSRWTGTAPLHYRQNSAENS